MEVRILSTKEPDEWHEVLNRFSKSDVYLLPEYHRAYELNGDGEAYGFVAEEDGQVLFHPFLMRRIEKVGSQPVSEPWYDIETVYGYSGPLCTTIKSAFSGKAWAEFAAWCREKHIVAEFIRFNPWMKNHRHMDDSYRVTIERETVVVRLDCSENELWTSYPPVQRNMVRKASSKGLVCERGPVSEGLSAFKRLYRETMDRIGADDYYYFSDAYFDYLSHALGDKVELFTVRDGNQVVASALFLLYDGRIHYHLAGNDVRYKGPAPNNLLLHTVARWGGEHGFQWLNLGGGRTGDPEDSLLRFKSSISELRLPFYVGQRIHCGSAYEQLCSQWMQQKGVTTRPSHFLIYRLK